MSVVLLFLAVVAVIAGWWLSQQRLMAKPWLETGPIDRFPGTGAVSLPAAKLGLGIFLAVAGCLFALFISAYSIRMHTGDWSPLPIPKLLWLNTGVLVASSVALQWAAVAARRGERDSVRTALLVGGAFAFAFLVGQLLAWRELSDAGYFLASNPANSFFYLLTALHGVHLLGGLIAWGRTTDKVWRGGTKLGDVRLGVELCAMYWHFLLFVWFLVFGLLLAAPDSLADFIINCTSGLSGS